METILLLLLVVAVIIIIVQATSKKKTSTPFTPSKSTVNQSQSSTYQLGDSQGAGEYEMGFEEFTLTGIHIPNRKKYILDNCQQEDKVEFIVEKNNPVNPLAIAVNHKGKLIGYIGDDDLDHAHDFINYEHEGLITSIDYDGDHLTVDVELGYIIPAKKKKPKKVKSPSTSNVTPEDFMIWKSNEVPSEFLKPQKDLEDKSHFFYGKKVCISGQLSIFPYRAELAKHLWELGADVQVNVGKTCGILIAGDGVGPSKLQRAQEYGVEIMKEVELSEKLNGFKSKYI